MEGATIPVPYGDCEVELMGDEAVIYRAATELVYHCNASAALVFHLCDGERTLAQIVTLLRATYPDAPALEEEISQVIALLVEHGALALR